MKLITTSWDDGHVADFRIADLLEKYNLKGTFYIPAHNIEHKVMGEKDVLKLSERFEIGGHTINHTTINSESIELFKNEIEGCYLWLGNLTGKNPNSFCFPRGVFNQAAIDYTLQCGFKIIRTTELLNPSINTHSKVIPTTLQVYRHSEFTYMKHLMKRFKFRSLLLYLKSKPSADLKQITSYYLDYIEQNGGCFHLWGHSWEIEENDLWDELEQLFKLLSNVSGVEYVSNEDLLSYYPEQNNA